MRQPRPLVTGKDLISAGIIPGSYYREILNEAYQAQLRAEFTTTTQGISWVFKNCSIEPIGVFYA